tara:strand:- start:54 stop:530 length:477 start_codon:yes stop_codon:yes gene_type:complete
LFSKFQIKPKDLKTKEKEIVSDIINGKEQLIKTLEFSALKNIDNQEVIITFLQSEFDTSVKETCTYISKELKWISKNINSLKNYFAKDSKDVFEYLANKDQSFFKEETILNSIVINNINFLNSSSFEIAFGAPTLINDNQISFVVDPQLREKLLVTHS